MSVCYINQMTGLYMLTDNKQLSKYTTSSEIFKKWILDFEF